MLIYFCISNFYPPDAQHSDRVTKLKTIVRSALEFPGLNIPFKLIDIVFYMFAAPANLASKGNYPEVFSEKHNSSVVMKFEHTIFKRSRLSQLDHVEK